MIQDLRETEPCKQFVPLLLFSFVVSVIYSHGDIESILLIHVQKGGFNNFGGAAPMHTKELI